MRPVGVTAPTSVRVLAVLRSCTTFGLVASVVAYLVATKPDLPWADLKNLLVMPTGVPATELELSVKVYRYQECRRIVSLTQAQPLEEDSVLPVSIVLTAMPGSQSIGDKMLAAPIGESALFARMQPSIQLPVGQYLITLVATCELPAGTVTETSAPARAIVVVRPAQPGVHGAR